MSDNSNHAPEWAVRMANTGLRLWHIGAGRVTNAKDVALGYPMKTAPAEGVWSEKDLGDVGAILFMAFHRDHLARIFASVRVEALREAVANLSRIFLAKWSRHGADFSPEVVMLDAVDATLGALVGAAPKETT